MTDNPLREASVNERYRLPWRVHLQVPTRVINSAGNIVGAFVRSSDAELVVELMNLAGEREGDD